MRLRYLFVFAALLPTPALAQLSGPFRAPQGPERFITDDMRRQIETNDERLDTDGNLVNAEGERLICRRSQHQTTSRLARAPRLCLTARQWRRRQ